MQATGTQAGPPAPAPDKWLCGLCSRLVESHVMTCHGCDATFHVECLAANWRASSCAGAGSSAGATAADTAAAGVVPEQGRCPCCFYQLAWMGLLSGMKSVGWGNKPRKKR